jgi:hypothetical protein
MSETPITQIAVTEYGLPFDAVNWQMSAAKLNTKTILVCDADYAAAYGAQLRGMMVRIIGTKTNGIFSPDHSYFWSADNTRWIEDTGIEHLHNLDTDAAGGLYRNVLLANISNYYETDILHPSANRFVVTVQGSAVNTTANGVELVQTTTANDFSQIRLPGGAIDLRKQCAFAISGYASSGKMMTGKLGIAMENVGATEALTPRFGLEVCDIANTQRTWNIVSGDGTAWNMEATSEAVERTTPQAIYMELNPLQNIKFTRTDINNLDVVTVKTSNVPGTTQTAVGNVWALGYKQNETTAKTFYLNSLRIIGKLPNHFLAPAQLVGAT